MKKILALSIMIAALTLVVHPPGIMVKASDNEVCQFVQVDLNDITNVVFEVQNHAFNSLTVVGVEISPGDNYQGVYYHEFSNDINSLHALNVITNSTETNRLYGTNYFLHSFRLNSYFTSIQKTQTGKNRKEYEEVGISPGLISAHQYDA